ncbi:MULTISPECIES: HXXEE domain-containing protein [unclassified Clostridium]|uniref:HXXEE domain-containing protein n=1 Tax=unclassified Clostridium TaxID=2614128 RepID=UPI000ECAF454|nr:MULTISPECIES: HXXEE domain-containing protein [unclassified Clostridium]HCQ89909.1 HXXEE domain-containing protein [Clostridium sp.]
MNTPSIYLLFLFSITLHNIEEALWIPRWSRYTQKFGKQVSGDEFHFAVLVITILAYLATGLFIFFPQNLILKYFFFGFMGAMIFNVVFPHLILTIILKKYSPGLITGALLIMPFNSLIIISSLNNSIINLSEVVISTIVVGILLLILIPILEKIGGKLIDYK